MDPFIISSIILAISFLFLLIINQKLKSKVIKISFLILSLIYLFLIIIFDNQYIYDLLKIIISYLWYPNYLMFITTIILSIIILIKTLIKKNNSLIQKIINYIYFNISFISYITYIRLNIDNNLYSSLYSKTALIIRRIISIIFLIWLFITTILKLKKRGKNER